MDHQTEAWAREYLAAFGTPSGQKTLAHLRQLFGDRLSYVAGDAYATAFREGQRSVIVHILSLLSLVADTKPATPVRSEEEEEE